ncbi:hypothetical protein Tco_0393935 [Tanacetum coccineum]
MRLKREGVDKRLSEMIDISYALTIDVHVILSRQRWTIENSKALLIVSWSTWWFRDSLAYLKLSLGSSIYSVWNRVDTPYPSMWDTAYWGFLGVRTTVGTDTPYLLDGYGVLGKSSLFFFVDQILDTSYRSRIIRRIGYQISKLSRTLRLCSILIVEGDFEVEEVKYFEYEGELASS